MKTVFRAEDVPAVERWDYWQDVMSNNAFPLQIRPGGSGDFKASAVTGRLGAIRVTEAMCPPAEAFNTPRLVRERDRDICSVFFVQRGRNRFEHNDRRCELRPGDFVLVDSSLPFHAVSGGLRHVSLVFPPSMLPFGRGEVSRLAGTAFTGDEGIGSLVSTLARRLPRHLDDPGAADAARLGTAVLDLVAVAMQDRLGHREAGDAGADGLLARIHAFIEEHLPEPELSPGRIAAAHHISVRYVHKLFQQEGTTAAGWIRWRRLQRCRQDLLDPALAGRPIGATALRWGFRNGAHFNRTFRAAYGLPPGEYRMMHARPEPSVPGEGRVA